MTKEEIKNYLTDNLKINIKVDDGYAGIYGIRATLELDGETISESEEWFDK